MSNNEQIDNDDLRQRQQRLNDLRARVKQEREDAPVDDAGSPQKIATERLSALRDGGTAAPQRPSRLGAKLSELRNQAGPGGNPASGKAGMIAAMALRVLRGDKNPDAPTIPGTDFTEEGVRRLMDWLSSRVAGVGTQQRRVAAMLYNYLSAPPRDGQEVVAGANLENLRTLEGILTHLQKNGLQKNDGNILQKVVAAARAKAGRSDGRRDDTDAPVAKPVQAETEPGDDAVEAVAVAKPVRAAVKPRDIAARNPKPRDLKNDNNSRDQDAKAKPIAKGQDGSSPPAAADGNRKNDNNSRDQDAKTKPIAKGQDGSSPPAAADGNRSE